MSTNQATASVQTQTSEAEQIEALKRALLAMWELASQFVERHGMDGDNTMTDEQHQDWQEAAGMASELVGKGRGN